MGDFSLNDALGNVLNTWQQVEGIRLQSKLTRAAIRDGDLDAAARYSDPQAKAGDYAAAPNARGIPVIYLLLGAVALYLIVKD